MSANKLKIEETDYSQEYLVICICSAIQDYRLSWHLNQQLGIELSKCDDFKYIPVKSKQEVTASVFLYSDKTNLKYQLVSNRNTDGYLLPDLKQVDYLLFIKGNTDANEWKDKLNIIANIPQILTAYLGVFNMIKNINILLTDLEIHITNYFYQQNAEEKKNKTRLSNEKKYPLGKN